MGKLGVFMIQFAWEFMKAMDAGSFIRIHQVLA